MRHWLQPDNTMNARIWWFGSDIHQFGWKFYDAGRPRIARWFFVIGNRISNFAEDTYRASH